MDHLTHIGKGPTNVMIAVGGLGLTDRAVVCDMIHGLQSDYRDVDFLGMAFPGTRPNRTDFSWHFKNNFLRTPFKLPGCFFAGAAGGTAPVLMHRVLSRALAGPTGDGKTSFDALIVIAGQKEQLLFSERKKNTGRAIQLKAKKTRVIILVVGQPGLSDDEHRRVLGHFVCAGERVGGVTHPFDPMGPERDGIINIAWRVSRGLVPMRKTIEGPAAHPSVIAFYNKCKLAFT